MAVFTYIKKRNLKPWQWKDSDLRPLRSQAIWGMPLITQTRGPLMVSYENQNKIANTLYFNNTWLS